MMIYDKKMLPSRYSMMATATANIANNMYVKLDDKYITPFFSEAISYKPNKGNKTIQQKPKNDNNKFIIGDIYGLSEEDCGEFEMPKKKYKLIGIVNNLNGIELDSVIMKQIEGNSSLIFSLSKFDCKTYNIPFEQGLQLFPKKLGWINLSLIERNKKEKEEKTLKQLNAINKDIELFDPNNLSTYPSCISDNTIRHMMIKISNCRPYGTIGCVLPNGRIVFNNANSKIKALVSNRIEGDNFTSSSFNVGESIPYRVMTRNISNVDCFNDYVDIYGCLYLELNFSKESLFRQRRNDNYVGVKTSSFHNLSINDIINFYSV